MWTTDDKTNQQSGHERFFRLHTNPLDLPYALLRRAVRGESSFTVPFSLIVHWNPLEESVPFREEQCSPILPLFYARVLSVLFLWGGFEVRESREGHRTLSFA